MTETSVPFYPTSEYQAHESLEQTLLKVASLLSIKVCDVPQYYLLNDKELYASNFLDETLYIRSLPDKLVLSNPPFFVDVKTLTRKDTGNMSIELSSFYFNLQRCKIGLPIFYLYSTESQGCRLFSPVWNSPSAIFIQPKWEGHQRKIFQKYASMIKDYFEIHWSYNIPIQETETAGSQDPFILIPIPSFEKSFDLVQFLNFRRTKVKS